MFSFEQCNVIFDTRRKTELIVEEPILKLSSLTDIIFIFRHKEATDCIEIRWFECLLLNSFQMEISKSGFRMRIFQLSVT